MLNGSQAYAPELLNGSPAYYPRIKDSLSIARARLDAAIADDDIFDDIDGEVAATTVSASGQDRRLDNGGGVGGGVLGLQQMLLGGAARPRDSIEIYRDQQPNLQVKTTKRKDDILNCICNVFFFIFQIPRDYAREFSEDTTKDISSISTDVSNMTSASGYNSTARRYGYSSYI